MMGFCNCRPYVSELPTLTYNSSVIGTFSSFVYICFTDGYPIIKEEDIWPAWLNELGSWIT
jgi:hypothetical protein